MLKTRFGLKRIYFEMGSNEKVLDKKVYVCIGRVVTVNKISYPKIYHLKQFLTSASTNFLSTRIYHKVWVEWRTSFCVYIADLDFSYLVKTRHLTMLAWHFYPSRVMLGLCISERQSFPLHSSLVHPSPSACGSGEKGRETFRPSSYVYTSL
jgi:hypothetical protein